MAEKGEKFRRKTRVERTGQAWRSVSNSLEEESLSPLEKKAKVKLHINLGPRVLSLPTSRKYPGCGWSRVC